MFHCAYISFDLVTRFHILHLNEYNISLHYFSVLLLMFFHSAVVFFFLLSTYHFTFLSRSACSFHVAVPWFRQFSHFLVRTTLVIIRKINDDEKIYINFSSFLLHMHIWRKRAGKKVYK